MLRFEGYKFKIKLLQCHFESSNLQVKNVAGSDRQEILVEVTGSFLVLTTSLILPMQMSSLTEKRRWRRYLKEVSFQISV